MGKIFFAALISAAAVANAGSSPFQNMEELRKGLGLSPVQADSSVYKVKVAILDKGFFGIENEIGQTLPAKTVYVPGPIAAPPEDKNDHGVRMAQLLAGIYAQNPKQAPGLELRLYNVFGYTNFKAAVDDVVKRHTDIVLYSEVWEYGGNSDGRGFINREVNRAVKGRVLWINAAGNYGATTYNGPIKDGNDGWLRLPDQNNGIKLTCKAPRGRKCPVRVVLNWNDFKDDSEAGTNKDLDLAVTDDLLNIVQSSSLHQSDDRNESREGYSKYPREIVETVVNPGTYYVRVKDVSQNFGAKDRLRIMVDGEGVEMPRADSRESLLPPADNANVLTVGAIDSDRSSRSASRQKPEILGASSVILDGAGEFRGSSNTAALTAGAAALVKARDGAVDRESFLSRLRTYSWAQGVLPMQALGFAPANGVCFQEAQPWPQMPEYIHNLLDRGGKFVQTTSGARVMVPFDPTTIVNVQRYRADDIVGVGPQGPQVYPRFGQVPPQVVEVFQRPIEAGLCDRSNAGGHLLSFEQDFSGSSPTSVSGPQGL